MRLAPALLLAVALGATGCRDRWLLGPFERRPARAAEAISWIPLPPGEIELLEHQTSSGRTRLAFRLPLPAEGEPGYTRLEIRFRAPLDGAKVDADGSAEGKPPGVSRLRLVDGQRVRGDTVSIVLAPFELERIGLEVHHHLRPAPIVAEVRLGRAVGR